jgi:hypothetical protein
MLSAWILVCCRSQLDESGFPGSIESCKRGNWTLNFHDGIDMASETFYPHPDYDVAKIGESMLLLEFLL